MKALFSLLLIICLLPSCSNDSGSGIINSSKEKKIKKQAIAVAEEYVMNRLKDAKKTITKNGIITIGDEQKMFVIDPSKIYPGQIDDDSRTDAIVTLDCFSGQYQITSEQLILLNSDGKITFNSAVESDMRIIEVKDRIITADVPSHSRNSPLFNCKSCREVIKYQFRKGDLVKME